ncbi:hypothetical protein CQA53_10405 [Helicobacter didelphidarum]|uniref:Uncharacterized protein n=1 Tax=Helicobacter didelphidarum TaxID=2040648 RepID=A0A3D8I7X6_9HELI|nr:hypothetical protein CQA53_10405 [Helicobacter didelphidarum]
MKTLKILYICWIIFFIFTWIISPLVAHNPDRTNEFFITLGFIAAPLIIYYLVIDNILHPNKRFIKLKILIFIFLIILICIFLFRDANQPPMCFKDNQPIPCEEFYNELQRAN